MADDNPDGYLLMMVNRAETSIIEDYSTREAAEIHKRAAQSQNKVGADDYVIRSVNFTDEPELTEVKYEYRLVWEDHLMETNARWFTSWFDSYAEMWDKRLEIQDKLTAASFTVHRKDVDGNIESARRASADPTETTFTSL